MNKTYRYDIELLPFIEIWQEYENRRAANARNPKKAKARNIKPKFMSLNMMYPTSFNTGGRHKTKEGELYSDYITTEMKKIDSEYVPFELGNEYLVSIVFYETYPMIYNKSGGVLNKDIDNQVKPVIDAMFKYRDENDCKVASATGVRVLTDMEPKMVILLTPMDSGVTIIQHNGKMVSADLLRDDHDLWNDR